MDNHDKLFVSIGETARGMSRSLAELASPREKVVRTAVVSVKFVLSQCKRLNKYRSSPGAVEAIGITYWLEAAQALKQALADLEGASKGMSRLSARQCARVHWCARSLTRLDRWLVRSTPPKDAVETWAKNEVWFQRFIAEYAPRSASGGDEGPAGK
jgi:hypothetical protein